MNLVIPESVRVGPFTYRVQIEPEPFVNDHQDGVLCGEANHNDCLIRVMERNHDQMYVTFWHEILHAIDDMMGTELSEETVNRLAPALVMFLCANGFIEHDSEESS